MPSALKKLYLSEADEEIKKHRDLKTGAILEKDIEGLPEPVQRYFRRCGLVGRERMVNASITWDDCSLRMSPGGRWRRLECLQFNSVPEPARIVYMRTRLFGVFPFEARDKFQDGRGNMLIKLLGFIPVADEKGAEMDRSALVTVLAETFFVPAYALQSYISWAPIDANTASAALRYGGLQVGGVFHFNNSGEFVRFETEDRSYSEKGSYKRLRWSASVIDYAQRDGVRMPAELKAVWHTADGDFEYFRGAIGKIDFNIAGC